MVVYVELVLINNIAINLLILYIVGVLCRHRQAWWRLLLSATIGAAYALLSPIINLSWEIIIKIALSMLMCAVMTNLADYKGYIRYIACFYLVTFLLGGSVLAFSYMSVPIKEALNSPISVLGGVVATVALIMLIVTKYMIRRRNIAQSRDFIVDVEIKCNGKVTKCKGLLDSGNRLHYKGIYPVVALSQAVLQGGKVIGKIKVKTASGATTHDLYQIDYCKVTGKRYSLLYAIVAGIESEYDVILHSCML